MTLASLDARALLAHWEGCRLIAYRDSAAIPTIGYGATRYLDGRRVQMGDKISQATADSLLQQQADQFAQWVDDLTVDTITAAQLAALTCLVYNIGVVQYRGSTLRQRVNANPNDPGIRDQFMRWYKAKGRGVLGLWRRRHAEADWYFGTSTTEGPFPGV